MKGNSSRKTKYREISKIWTKIRADSIGTTRKRKSTFFCNLWKKLGVLCNLKSSPKPLQNHSFQQEKKAHWAHMKMAHCWRRNQYREGDQWSQKVVAPALRHNSKYNSLAQTTLFSKPEHGLNAAVKTFIIHERWISEFSMFYELFPCSH